MTTTAASRHHLLATAASLSSMPSRSCGESESNIFTHAREHGDHDNDDKPEGLYRGGHIYSEPTLVDARTPSIPHAEHGRLGGMPSVVAYSENALPFVLHRQQRPPAVFDTESRDDDVEGDNDGDGDGDDTEDQPSDADDQSTTQREGGKGGGHGSSHHRPHHHYSKFSIAFSDTTSLRSIATNMGSLIFGHKTSFSTREIRDQHMQIQKKYRPIKKNEAGCTDPVDFEGVLKIIGGCSFWQIFVYLLISLQQIPHAMFNLSVVYMMYQPDHWCQVPGTGINSTSTVTGNLSASEFLWSHTDAMNTSIIYPKTGNTQRDVSDFHDQCHYYNRGAKRYEELRRMTLAQAEEAVKREDVPIEKCESWYYADDVMKLTIVTQWNLVCEDNFMRAHSQLIYSGGLLVGCVIGGLASDRVGRKPTIIGFGILSSMFNLLLPYSTYYPLFLFIRFCSAVCNEAADLAAYVLCMEITGVRYRGMVGSLLQAPWAVGYALLALLAYFVKSWQSIQLITAVIHTASIFLICALPESPRWLIVSNRLVEAEHVIRKACRDPPFPFNRFHINKSSLPCDLELKRHPEKAQWVKDKQRTSIFDLLKSRELCVRTAIICIVWIATALVYYGLVIAFSDQSAPGRVLFNGNFFANNAIAGAIELPTLIACVYLMHFGRKRAQMITLGGAAIAILGAMSAMSYRDHVFSLVLMLMSKIFIQGAFNILYIFTSEMYPTVIRNSAVGFSSMMARIGSGVSVYIAMLSDVTLAVVPMSIFALFSLFACFLVYFLPETRDAPLPETLDDAVQLLAPEPPFICYTYAGKYSLPYNGDSGTATTVAAATTHSSIDNLSRTDDDDDDSSSSITTAVHQAVSVSSSMPLSQDSLSILARKKSETFTELPVIFEHPSSAENTITSQIRPEALASMGLRLPRSASALAEEREGEDADDNRPSIQIIFQDLQQKDGLHNKFDESLN